MKTLRNFTYLTLAIFAISLIASCGSAVDRLPGTWTTESVTANVDSTLANMTSIDQNISSTKTTKFILNEDKTMALSIDGYTTDAFWSYDSDTKAISFHLENNIGDDIELGVLDGDQIVYTSKVKYGSITAVYVKE